jgi:hypothetical protein
MFANKLWPLIKVISSETYSSKYSRYDIRLMPKTASETAGGAFPPSNLLRESVSDRYTTQISEEKCWLVRDSFSHTSAKHAILKSRKHTVLNISTDFDLTPRTYCQKMYNYSHCPNFIYFYPEQERQPSHAT